MRSFALNLIVFASVAVLSASCLHAAQVDPEEISGLAAALTKVSAPVHSTVRYKNPPADIGDAALLALATAHNPSLLAAFDGYVLRARQDGPNSSVLVCKGEIALVEDAGCTGQSDWHATQADHPCDYVLDLATTCP